MAKWYQKPMQRLAAAGAGEDVGHAQRQRGRAAGAVEERLLADLARQRGHVGGGDREAPARRSCATAAAGVAPTTPAGEFTAK